MRPVIIITLCLSALLLGGFPALSLLTAADALPDHSLIQQAWNRALFEQSLATAKRSFLISVLCTGLGYLLFRSSLRVKYSAQWLLPYTLCYALTPYLVAQGWIQIWSTFEMDNYSIYSTGGLAFLQTIQFTPLAYLLFHFTHHPQSSAQADIEALLNTPLIKREWYIHLPRLLPPITLNLVLLFWLSFWNYETPSILREKTYALNLYAAFGSFFDYRQAIYYMAHVSIYLLPCLIGFALFIRRQSEINRSLPSTATSNSLLHLLGLAVIPIIALLVPLIGIIGHIPSLTFLFEKWSAYSGDIGNTIVVGFLAALVSSTITLSLHGLALKFHVTRYLTSTALLLLFIPALGSGIGFLHWFSEHIPGRAGIERLIFINALLNLPIAMFASAIIFPPKATSENDTLRLYGLSAIQRVQLLGRHYLAPRLLMLLTLCFLFTIREVPASLLNYPPGGSTLVLSIETMLHFEQPELISSLCLAHLLLSLGAITMMLISIHILKK